MWTSCERCGPWGTLGAWTIGGTKFLVWITCELRIH